MTLSTTTPPATEPVSLAAAKAFLRVTSDAEDALIASLITALRARIEDELGLAMLTTGFRETLDGFPCGPLVLARGPLTAVGAIAVADVSGAFHDLTAADYVPSLGSRPGRIMPEHLVWPTPGVAADGVRVDYSAGFGDDPTDVPAPLIQAILHLIAHAFDHRGEPAPISLVEPWIAPFRRLRL